MQYDGASLDVVCDLGSGHGLSAEAPVRSGHPAVWRSLS